MANQEFKNGDVVYHKANDLQMVVVGSEDDGKIKCKLENAKGAFEELSFFDFELSFIPGKPSKLNLGPIKD